MIGRISILALTAIAYIAASVSQSYAKEYPIIRPHLDNVRVDNTKVFPNRDPGPRATVYVASVDMDKAGRVAESTLQSINALVDRMEDQGEATYVVEYRSDGRAAMDLILDILHERGISNYRIATRQSSTEEFFSGFESQAVLHAYPKYSPMTPR